MDEVDRVAEAVRAALEVVQAAGDTKWHENLKGACSVGSAALVRMLRRRGVQASWVFGAHAKQPKNAVHCWVVVGDEIIDVTATQLNPPADVVERLRPVLEIPLFPRVHRTRDKTDYFILHTGREAAREVRDWENRVRLTARVVRVAERLLR